MVLDFAELGCSSIEGDLVPTEALGVESGCGGMTT